MDKIIMDITILITTGGILIGIIGYFLNRTMVELDKIKDLCEKNTIKINTLENNHDHLVDKFDMLYEAVKDLTREIKSLNIQLGKKKDI